MAMAVRGVQLGGGAVAGDFGVPVAVRLTEEVSAVAGCASTVGSKGCGLRPCIQQLLHVLCSPPLPAHQGGYKVRGKCACATLGNLGPACPPAHTPYCR